MLSHALIDTSVRRLHPTPYGEHRRLAAEVFLAAPCSHIPRGGGVTPFSNGNALISKHAMVSHFSRQIDHYTVKSTRQLRIHNYVVVKSLAAGRLRKVLRSQLTRMNRRSGPPGNRVDETPSTSRRAAISHLRPTKRCSTRRGSRPALEASADRSPARAKNPGEGNRPEPPGWR